MEQSYKGGGTSRYHPKVLLKILIYAYLRNLYSSRKIEEALGENLHFMWLAGTNNQFIVYYTLAQTTADTTTLIDHVDIFIESYTRPNTAHRRRRLRE